MKSVINECEPSEFRRLFELRDMACMKAEEEEQRRQWISTKRSMASRPSCRPYKKLRSAEEAEKHRGWVEVVTRICAAFPLVFGEKHLTATDVKAHSNRFLLPAVVQGALRRQLRPWEKAKAEGGLAVRVLDRMGRVHQLQLVKWPSNNWLVLNGKNYRGFLESNEMQRKVQENRELRVGVWLFRLKKDDCLCFVVVEFELSSSVFIHVYNCRVEIHHLLM